MFNNIIGLSKLIESIKYAEQKNMESERFVNMMLENGSFAYDNSIEVSSEEDNAEDEEMETLLDKIESIIDNSPDDDEEEENEDSFMENIGESIQIAIEKSIILNE